MISPVNVRLLRSASRSSRAFSSGGRRTYVGLLFVDISYHRVMIQLCPVRIARQFTPIHDSGWLWLGLAPHGAPRRGLAWLGKDWRGKAWRGVSRHAQAGRGKARAGRPSGQGLRVLTGGRPPIVACLGKAGLGSSRQGEARLGLAWRGLAGPDKARAAEGSGKRPRAFAGDFGHRLRSGRAGQGKARHGVAGLGRAGLGAT